MKRYTDKQRLDFLLGRYNGKFFKWEAFIHHYYDFVGREPRQAIDAAIRESGDRIYCNTAHRAVLPSYRAAGKASRIARIAGINLNRSARLGSQGTSLSRGVDRRLSSLRLYTNFLLTSCNTLETSLIPAGSNHALASRRRIVCCCMMAGRGRALVVA